MSTTRPMPPPRPCALASTVASRSRWFLARRRSALVPGVLEAADKAARGHLGAKTAVGDPRDTADHAGFAGPGTLVLAGLRELLGQAPQPGPGVQVVRLRVRPGRPFDAEVLAVDLVRRQLPGQTRGGPHAVGDRAD